MAKTAGSTKMAYYFGKTKTEGKSNQKQLLGGKGANLADMTSIGLPVPPGFTITTEVCDLYYKHKQKLPPGLMDEVRKNVGLLEMASLERGLVWLATVSTVAPLLGFLGTVIGMIEAFAAIELAGEVEATLVAGGIKVALITTAAGLVVAIPISIFHNYFVTRVDNMVIDMEESAQKMIDALHEIHAG